MVRCAREGCLKDLVLPISSSPTHEKAENKDRCHKVRASSLSVHVVVLLELPLLNPNDDTYAVVLC